MNSTTIGRTGDTEKKEYEFCPHSVYYQVILLISIVL
jgi:hypothetical protein